MNYMTPIGLHNGKSWEDLCQYSLNIRFKGGYKEVPASPGDYGLDGFTVEGEAYQCYCPEKECTDDDLYANQRDKINEDLKKLKINQKQLEKLLANTKLKRWYLLTPKITKNDLISYCNKKTDEVKAWGLPYIDSNFEVIPLDHKHIAAEYPTALNALNYTTGNASIITKIDVGSTPVVDEDISEYKQEISNNEHTNNAQKKHLAMFPNDGIDRADVIVKRVDRTVGNLLLGDSILKNWEIIAQDQLERFNKVVKLLESRVEEMCEIPSGNNNLRYQEIRALVSETIDKDFKSLSETMRMSLTERIMADWLLRCPLKFE